MRFHYLRGQVSKRNLKLVHRKSEEHVADLSTKESAIEHSKAKRLNENLNIIRHELSKHYST